ncbi:hypothetical protein [Parafilimonas sp.]|uniref:hypothetical protein n=1 Tax=Parafilimonas sp. TaxID=1969739 RepID=UPI0039E5EC03
MVIVYKKTVFREPALIDNEAYSRLKNAISGREGLPIYTPNEFFTRHFKRRLRMILYTFPVFVALLSFMIIHGTPARPLPVWWIICIILLLASGSTSFFSLLLLLLEGTSYATYLHTKKQYYTAMQFAISKSSNYADFVQLFFGTSGRRTVSYLQLAKQAPPQPKQPVTTESVITGIFRVIHKVSWIVGLCIVCWFIWKSCSPK